MKEDVSTHDTVRYRGFVSFDELNRPLSLQSVFLTRKREPGIGPSFEVLHLGLLDGVLGHLGESGLTPKRACGVEELASCSEEGSSDGEGHDRIFGSLALQILEELVHDVSLG